MTPSRKMVFGGLMSWGEDMIIFVYTISLIVHTFLKTLAFVAAILRLIVM